MSVTVTTKTLAEAAERLKEDTKASRSSPTGTPTVIWIEPITEVGLTVSSATTLSQSLILLFKRSDDTLWGLTQSGELVLIKGKP